MDIKPVWFHLFPKLRDYSIKGSSNDHVCIYDNHGLVLESIDYSDIVPFYTNGVQYTLLPFILLWGHNFSIYRLNNEYYQSIIPDSISFIKDNIGCKYQWPHPHSPKFQSWYANPNITDPRNDYYDIYLFPEDDYIDYWFCTEIIWASFLHQNIQLDSTPNPEKCNRFRVSCEDIKHSNNLKIVKSYFI